MKSVELYRLAGDVWEARIFGIHFQGSYEECLAWLRANGENP